jgi:Zn ribbon nucleic-acid-binding protein
MCPKCEQNNTTLMWMESGNRMVCLPCATGRREEQNRIESKWIKDNDAALISPPSSR